MMKRPLYVLIAAGMAAAACQTTQPNRFSQADANHDDKLTREEINSYVVTDLFESRDANDDRKLTKDEWLAGPDAGQEKLFKDRDANADGTVTLDEALAYGRKHGSADQLMRAADKDKNATLSREEVTAYYASKEGPAR